MVGLGGLVGSGDGFGVGVLGCCGVGSGVRVGCCAVGWFGGSVLWWGVGSGVGLGVGWLSG